MVLQLASSIAAVVLGSALCCENPALAETGSDYKFAYAHHAINEASWISLVKNELKISAKAYHEYVQRMDRQSLYASVSRSRVPVYVPAKEGIEDLVAPRASKLKPTTKWEFCADGDLPKVRTISHDRSGWTKFAFTYFATGAMRADVKDREAAPYDRVQFDFLVVGTSIQKFVPDEPVTNRASRSAMRVQSLGANEPMRYIAFFEKNNVSYAVLLGNMSCGMAEQVGGDCTALDEVFFGDLFQSMRLVGGLPHTRKELSVAQHHFDELDQATMSVGGKNASNFTYLLPGILYESSRQGVKNFVGHIRKLQSPFESDSLYYVKDHRELANVASTGGDIEDFFNYPWRDSYCASGFAEEDRCDGEVGSIWQDVFPDRCRQLEQYSLSDIGQPISFSPYLIAVTPQGAIVLARRDHVAYSQPPPGETRHRATLRRSASCEFLKLGILANGSRPGGFAVQPPYASFILHRSRHPGTPRQE